jgi:hypothetical protein
MWSIISRDAPIVAEKFQEGYDDRQVAYAYHEAVGVLRGQVGEEDFLS